MNETKQRFYDALVEYVGQLENNYDLGGVGIIDLNADVVYPISNDTKVISKILESRFAQSIKKFAEENKYKIILPESQNFYPDVTLINGHNFALDIKSTYRKNDKKVNGMTLGAFTGYFRNRTSTKNTVLPYSEYAGHFVLGIIYSRTDIDENKSFPLHDILGHKQVIPLPIKDVKIFIQEKYRIASDHPGSGNTKNIGSVKDINKLINGKGPFVKRGENVFDEYWSNYSTNDMSNGEKTYKNLKEYDEINVLKNILIQKV